MATKKDSDEKRIDEISDQSQQITIGSEINIGGGNIVGVISDKGVTKPRILFVGSDPDFVATRSEFLQKAGYAVIVVQNLHEAKEYIEHEKLDLAIINIDLLKDIGDDQDHSGLAFANELPGFLPKIILSKFPEHETLRNILRGTTKNNPSNISFISVADGPDALLIEISRILEIYRSSINSTDPPSLEDKKPQTAEKLSRFRIALKDLELQIYIVVFLGSIAALIWLYLGFRAAAVSSIAYILPLLSAGFSGAKIISRLAGDTSTDAPPPEKKKKSKGK